MNITFLELFLLGIPVIALAGLLALGAGISKRMRNIESRLAEVEQSLHDQ